MIECGHKSGDTVNGRWLCASCYKYLNERPRYYRMVRVDAGCHFMSDAPHRQEVYYAPIALARSVTLAEFVKMIAIRLVSQTRGSFDMADAIDYAVEILRNLDEPFGADDIDWSVSGAWDLVSEDMSYWDDDGNDGSN